MSIDWRAFCKACGFHIEDISMGLSNIDRKKTKSKTLRSTDLGDTNAFSDHMRANPALEAVGRSQIHLAAKERFEVILQCEQTQIPNGTVEFDQQVDITAGRRLVPRRGSKQG